MVNGNMKEIGQNQYLTTIVGSLRTAKMENASQAKFNFLNVYLVLAVTQKLGNSKDLRKNAILK